MITIEDVKTLATITGPCLSVLHPIGEALPDARPESRLNTAIQQAGTLLRERGFTEEACLEFLRPLRKVARNTNWSGRTGSVVIFRAPGFTKASFWPEVLEPRVILGDQFHTLPLLAGLATRSFWLLALSVNGIHLYRGNERGLTEVDLPESLPRSLNGAGHHGDHDLEARSTPGARTHQSAQIRFGTSSRQESRDAHLRSFFRAIDRAIQPILRESHDPLVLASVVHEIAIYHQINTCPSLLHEAVHGSPQALGEERIHREALQIVARTASRACAEQTIDELSAASRRGLLLTDLGEISAISSRGQIERLFLRPMPQTSEALLNETAVAVIRNSGTVVCNAAMATPGEGVAAILRYAALGANPV